MRPSVDAAPLSHTDRRFDKTTNLAPVKCGYCRFLLLPGYKYCNDDCERAERMQAAILAWSAWDRDSEGEYDPDTWEVEVALHRLADEMGGVDV